jgi:hypothetical protein
VYISAAFTWKVLLDRHKLKVSAINMNERHQIHIKESSKLKLKIGIGKYYVFGGCIDSISMTEVE